MGILDGIIGGVVAAGVSSMVQKLLEQQGGLQGLVAKFEQTGFGETVSSWIGKGSNLPISAEQIKSVLGSEQVAILAEKFGLDRDELAEQVAKFLPDAVDEMTPEGELPQAA